jgi:hypothetical protein
MQQSQEAVVASSRFSVDPPSQRSRKKRVILKDGFGNGDAPAQLEYAMEFAQRGALVRHVRESRASRDDVDRGISNSVERLRRTFEKRALTPHPALYRE